MNKSILSSASILILFGIITLSLAEPYRYNMQERQLINGHEAEQHQFPWQVSIKTYLENGLILICGGTLISEQWIITAASCVSANNTKEILIGLGSNELHAPEIVMSALSITIHENFNVKQIRLPIDNLAVIKMNGTVNSTEWIEPILLPGADQTGISFEGVTVKSSGWGSLIIQVPKRVVNEKSSDDDYNRNASSVRRTKTNQEIAIAKDQLNWHELTVISNNDCKTVYGDDIKENLFLCTRVVSGGNVCGCDIGGPLIIFDPEGWKLIGVASYTPGCDSSNAAVFTRVTSYLNWISNITGIKITLY